MMFELALLFLHLERELEGKGSGATIAKLQAFAVMQDFSSPRRVNTFIDRSVEIGRVERLRISDDRRVRRLVPTDILIDYLRRHALLSTDAIGIVLPNSPLSEIIRSDRSAYLRLALAAARKRIADESPFRQSPEVTFFASRDGGLAIMNALLFSCYEQNGALSPDLAFRVSFASVSQRFGISRSHVRNVIRTAAKSGYLECVESNESEAGPELRLSPMLIDASKNAAASSWAIFHVAGENLLHR
ncbi:MAG: hypothetical protein WC807_16295 [Hyphomicrobium sp.]